MTLTPITRFNTRTLLIAAFAYSTALSPSLMATTTDIAANPFIGSWQLVSGQYLDKNGTWIDYKTRNLKAIKVLSNSHFSFTTVTEKVEQGVMQHEFWAAGTGRYEYTDSQYIEYPALNSFGAGLDTSFAFEYELNGNQLHTKRIEAGQLKEAEVWQKLD